MKGTKGKLSLGAAGCAAGAVNGIFGGGGGMIVVPLLTSVGQKPPLVAHATAILVILPVSLASAIVYLVGGWFDAELFVAVSIGVVLGGAAGAKLLGSITPAAATVAFAAVMFAGMGMGGGTVLIPILTMFCGVPQHLAQSVNLLSFLPMAAVSLRVHAGNGLLDTKNILWMIVPATLLSALGGILVQGVAAGTLRVGFGAFLCLLSVYQFYTGIRAAAQERKGKGGG